MMKKYYIAKNKIHIVNDIYDSGFTRVTKTTFDKWLRSQLGIVQIMFDDGNSEYFYMNSLVAYTKSFLTI